MDYYIFKGMWEYYSVLPIWTSHLWSGMLASGDIWASIFFFGKAFKRFFSLMIQRLPLASGSFHISFFSFTPYIHSTIRQALVPSLAPWWLRRVSSFNDKQTQSRSLVPFHRGNFFYTLQYVHPNIWYLIMMSPLWSLTPKLFVIHSPKSFTVTAWCLVI